MKSLRLAERSYNVFLLLTLIVAFAAPGVAEVIQSSPLPEDQRAPRVSVVEAVTGNSSAKDASVSNLSNQSDLFANTVPTNSETTAATGISRGNAQKSEE